MLDKECTCETHQGPHWLHMDHLAKQQNIELLCVALGLFQSGNARDGGRYLEEYAHAEERRMKEKLLHMQEGERYPYSLLGEVEDVQALALSVYREIGVAIQHHIDAVRESAGELVQQALF